MMGFTEKVDVLDLLINCIKDSEKKLDDLVARIEEVSNMVPVSGLLKPVGNSVYLLVPKEIAQRHGLKLGDHILAYIKKA
jgi:hypothetical protein